MAFKWTDLIAPVIGSGLGLLGSKMESDANQEAATVRADSLARNADVALQQAQPYGVGGAGGTFDTDPESRTALLSLSPELQNIYQGALSRSGLFGQQAMNLAGSNPFEAADMFYNQQQALVAPEEAQLRSDAETRLLAQGRLGSTGGQRAMGELEKQILASRDQRRLGSMSQAQGLINALLGRESADIGTATGLLNIPLQYGALGRGIGGNLGTAAAYGLSARTAGANSMFDANNRSLTGAGLQALGGLFSNPVSSRPGVISQLGPGYNTGFNI